MYQPERFRIDIPEAVPTYAFVAPCNSSVSYRRPYETSVSYYRPYETRVSYQFPCESAVSYRYPCESTVSYQYPYEIVVKREDRNNGFVPETTAIRRDLKQIKNDIREIKQRQPSSAYYVLKEESSSNVYCPICNSSTSKSQPKQCSEIPLYYCEKCQSFVEKRPYTLGPIIRSMTPTTTYQDSYQRPTYSATHRRITLNELQTEHPPSSAPAQHPRHWIPTASKNNYPHRRWNLSVPHSEP